MKINLNLIRPLSLAAVLACTGAGLHAQQGGGAAPGGSPIPGTASAQDGSRAGASGSAALKRNDRNFVTKAAADGLYEVEAARLAEQKATDRSVKELAAMLVQHHTQANNELMQLASSKGVTLPGAMPRARQNELDKLSQLSGPAFDREFMRRIGIAAHQSDIKLFENGSRSAKDPELKAWIDKTLPTLREHLAQAQKIPMPAAGSTSTSQGMGAAGSASTGAMSGSQNTTGASGMTGAGTGAAGAGAGSGSMTGSGSGAGGTGSR